MKGHLGEKKKKTSLEKKGVASIEISFLHCGNNLKLDLFRPDKELSEFVKTVTAFPLKANNTSEALLQKKQINITKTLL